MGEADDPEVGQYADGEHEVGGENGPHGYAGRSALTSSTLDMSERPGMSAFFANS